MTTLIRGFVVLLALAGAAPVAAVQCARAGLSGPFGQDDRAVRGRRPADVIAHRGQEAVETWGQQIYTENVPGGGGNTGAAMAARAPADDYTILVVSTGFIVNPSLYAKVPYDPIKDFAPVTLVASSPNVLSVYPEVPAKSVRELIDLVKASPGKYSFAQPGTGSTPHLAGRCSSSSSASTW